MAALGLPAGVRRSLSGRQRPPLRGGNAGGHPECGVRGHGGADRRPGLTLFLPVRRPADPLRDPGRYLGAAAHLAAQRHVPGGRRRPVRLGAGPAGGVCRARPGGAGGGGDLRECDAPLRLLVRSVALRHPGGAYQPARLHGGVPGGGALGDCGGGPGLARDLLGACGAHHGNRARLLGDGTRPAAGRPREDSGDDPSRRAPGLALRAPEPRDLEGPRGQAGAGQQQLRLLRPLGRPLP